MIIMPQCKKSCPLTCSSNEDSDQPARPRSMNSVFIIRMTKVCIIERICLKVRFLTLQLNYCFLKLAMPLIFVTFSASELFLNH